MNTKILGAIAAVALLAACAKEETVATGQGATASGPVPGSQEDLVANVGDRVFFDTSMSNLSQDSQATLTRQAAWLAKFASVNVQIAGNCDERGTVEYNQAIGQRRANAASSFLKAKGVAVARIVTISYGKSRATGQDEAGWRMDRNATTSVR